jgi:hypothetical protein
MVPVSHLRSTIEREEYETRKKLEDLINIGRQDERVSLITKSTLNPVGKNDAEVVRSPRFINRGDQA